MRLASGEPVGPEGAGEPSAVAVPIAPVMTWGSRLPGPRKVPRKPLA